MIRHLKVANYALIQALEIAFPEGLTIITGETGAGKSILLGALGLVMGERADLKALYDPEQKCIVEATFHVGRYQLQEFFRTHELDYEDECIIRRELLPSGKSRAFINDTPVRLEVLRKLAQALVDVHQQFDTRDIHEVSFQMRMIDALAGTQQQAADFRRRYEGWLEKMRRLDQLRARKARSEREQELLHFQLEELSEARFEPGEQERLEEALRRLEHAEEIKRVLSAAFLALHEREPSLLGQLSELYHALGQVARYDSGAAALHERLERVRLELEDIAMELEKQAEHIAFDPERAAQLQQRLDLLYRLQQKHQVQTVEELLEVQRRLEAQLAGFGDLSEQIAQLEAAVQAEEEALRRQAEALSQKRRAVLPTFTRQVTALLHQLAMPHARFEVAMSRQARLGPAGFDEVQFRFAANPGSRLMPIKDVASGGELSRLTLVVKSLVASAIPLPTLVFDEIDAGISGGVALRMGEILRKLSDDHQVIVITHSPQVAAQADAHYFAYKEVADQRTRTRIRLLDEAARVEALAAMLSESPPTPAALENARELLARARKHARRKG